jgi:hypothetical protein
MTDHGRRLLPLADHIMVMPGNRSLIGFGVWGPEKDQLANIRLVFLPSLPSPSFLRASPRG